MSAFWVRFGSRLGLGSGLELGLGVELGLCPYLDPTRSSQTRTTHRPKDPRDQIIGKLRH